MSSIQLDRAAGCRGRKYLVTSRISLAAMPPYMAAQPLRRRSLQGGVLSVSRVEAAEQSIAMHSCSGGSARRLADYSCSLVTCV